MKNLRICIFTGLVVFLLASCGSGDGVTGACSSSAVKGSWYNSTTTETLTFNSDCTGASDVCESTFTYPNVTNSSGAVLVTVTSTGAVSGCLPLGETSCAYVIEDDVLGINCGSENLYYNKQ